VCLSHVRDGTGRTAPPPPQQQLNNNQNMGPLMNNGARDVTNNDIQKLQQQLQDIKDQVPIPLCPYIWHSIHTLFIIAFLSENLFNKSFGDRNRKGV